METIGSSGLLLLALVIAIFCLAAGLWISWLLRPSNPTKVKLETYECGEPTVGPSQVRFKTRFYLLAIVFVIFDVEAIFLFPWAVAFEKLGLFAFFEMLVFVGILLIGLMYAWRKGALSWRS